MRLLAALCVVAVSGWALTASADPAAPVADPVITAYREFKAARDKGDLVTAEAAGARALAASEAKSGDGGVTGALALNLAIVRLSLKHQAEALAPAQRAYDLGQKGAKGVDPLAAQLTLAEAKLAPNDRPSRRYAQDALAEADKRSADKSGGDIDTFAYSTARALVEASAAAKDWAMLTGAWKSAELHVAGASGDVDIARAQALVGQGGALMAQHKDDEADAALFAAIYITAPLAPEDTEAETITPAEQLYAQAKALRSAEMARRYSEAASIPRVRDIERLPLPNRPVMCDVSLRPVPLPTFPTTSLMDYGVGAVVLRVRTNAKGEVLAAHVIAAAPAENFVAAVTDPKIKWKLVPGKAQRPGCRLDSNDMLVVVKFVIG